MENTETATTYGTGEWQLYGFLKDPAETNCLSIQFPDIKRQSLNKWNEYARKNKVYDYRGHFDALYREVFALKKKN
jgi:hypothetical protein